MVKTQILLLLSITFTIASSQKLPPAALASIIKEVLSSSNPEQAIQLIKGATKRKGMPEFTVSRRSVIQERALPRTVELPVKMATRIQKTNDGVIPDKVFVKQTQEYPEPTQIFVQKPNEYLLPKNVIVQKTNEIVMESPNGALPPMNVVIQNERVPSKIIVKKPELAMPKKVLIKNPEVAMGNRKILVQKGNEIPFLKNLILNGGLSNKGLPPNTVVVQKNNMSPQIRGVSEVNVVPELVMRQPKVVEYVTREKVAAVNPFLPAASPVSSFAAAAPGPNAVPQSRGQFLRKIPIPPPTI